MVRDRSEVTSFEHFWREEPQSCARAAPRFVPWKELRSLGDVHKWGGWIEIVSRINAATQDTRNVVKWIYETLNLDVDFVIPFAATSEAGKSVDDIDAAISEVSHRMMLTNVLRLIGEIKIQKRRNVLVVPRLWSYLESESWCV